MQSYKNTPRSHARTPVVVPPHPPLQSGGWYHRTVVEMPGPGRPPVTVPPARKSMGLAILLSALFGPLGLWYLSVTGGLVSTVVTIAVLGFAGVGFAPLLFLWPLAVVAAVCGVRLRLEF